MGELGGTCAPFLLLDWFEIPLSLSARVPRYLGTWVRKHTQPQCCKLKTIIPTLWMAGELVHLRPHYSWQLRIFYHPCGSCIHRLQTHHEPEKAYCLAQSFPDSAARTCAGLVMLATSNLPLGNKKMVHMRAILGGRMLHYCVTNSTNWIHSASYYQQHHVHMSLYAQTFGPCFSSPAELAERESDYQSCCKVFRAMVDNSSVTCLR